MKNSEYKAVDDTQVKGQGSSLVVALLLPVHNAIRVHVHVHVVQVVGAKEWRERQHWSRRLMASNSTRSSQCPRARARLG